MSTATPATDTRGQTSTLTPPSGLFRKAGVDEAMAEAIMNTASAAAGADRKHWRRRPTSAGLEARMYRALWIQAAALIGTQLVIAGKRIRSDLRKDCAG